MIKWINEKMTGYFPITAGCGLPTVDCRLISYFLINENILFMFFWMWLNQIDIRELQLAKSAIRAGIEILIKEFGVSYNDIGKVYLAGGFGNHINVDSAIRIGLLPKELRNYIVLAGNSSLGGAVDSLLNPDREEKVKKILNKVHYIELSSNPDFNDYFAEYMLFNDE